MRQDYIRTARAKGVLDKMLFLSMFKCDDTGHHFNRHQLWLFAGRMLLQNKFLVCPGLKFTC